MDSRDTPESALGKAEDCDRCGKRTGLCVCSCLPSVNTRLSVLILQHPQEPDKELGTARLAQLSLPNSTLRIGLSWPNLSKALGRDANPSRWVVLYLGSSRVPRRLNRDSTGPAGPRLHLVDRKGEALESPPTSKDLDGIVVLDGTWSQAKAIWWRNPWLLKLRRGVLESPTKSLYRELRREPRRECLSTLEAIADSLVALDEPATTRTALRTVFARLLELASKSGRAKPCQASEATRYSGSGSVE